jgi:DinB family protein
MNLANELAALFRRDLTRLIQQLEAFPDNQILWQCAHGVTNSAGNLVLHLEGNLREFIGRQLGGIPYARVRSEEFAPAALPVNDLIGRMEGVRQLVPDVVAALSAEQLQATYPEDALGVPLSTQQFLMSLLGHLNYHLGQIDYARRILSHGTSVRYAGL